MKNNTIRKTKDPKIKSPKSQKDVKDTWKITKLLLKLFVLGACLRTGYGYGQRLYRQSTSEHTFDKKTLATLIDKRILMEGNTTHLIFWLDGDNNLKTAEGSCSMFNAKLDKVMQLNNITNGTTKSLEKWKEITHPYKIHYTK